MTNGTLETLTNGTTRRHYSTKETSILIRAALKAAFPGVKFSVTTSYASDDIEHLDSLDGTARRRAKSNA